MALGMKPAVVKKGWVENVLIKFVVLKVLPRFPKNAATAPEMNQKKKGTPAKDFYTEHAYLKQMIAVFLERESSKLKPHPLFGELNKEEWGIILAKHLDHHLRQFGC
jgi:hypothetical protein